MGSIPHRTMAEQNRWLAGAVEAVIDPARRIVDAHHHLWWRPPEAYQLPELMADLDSGHDMRASVFVQCNAMYRADGPEEMRPVGETDYVNDMAAIGASGLYGDRRPCAGIVGYADLRLGDAVAPVLEAHLAAGDGRFRGIRQQAQWDAKVGALAKITPPRYLLADSAFRRGFARLAPLGLSFDAWVYFTQLDEVAALAAAFPDTPIILDHIGAPLGVGPYAKRRKAVFETWREGINLLARHAGVTVKLGGLGMAAYGFGFEAREHPPSSEELAQAWGPYIIHCIEAFGPDRCMFESNFPVDRQSCSYRTLWNAFKRIAADCPEADKDALFHGTATRVYRLEHDLGSDDGDK
ncbi:MAG: amidohydrolase family protein [Sphingomonas sp.]|uniref:amidohydrolase family protein n=1 Tax=Sphingomonas sp. TaxID=28214 RepID=UPI003564F174